MGVTAYDRVDFRSEFSSEVDDLSAARSGSIPPAARAGVSDDHDEVGAALSERRSDAVDNRSGIVEAKAYDVRRASRRRSVDRRHSNDSDFRPAASNDGVIRDPFYISPIGVADVRAEDSELRLTHSGAQRVDSPIKLVIPQSR